MVEVPELPVHADRQAHAAALQDSLKTANREAEQARAASQIQISGAKPGVYIEFESPSGIELKLPSLEHRGRGMELVAVREVAPEGDGPAKQLATVFVPEGGVKAFLTKFEAYATKDTEKGVPKNHELVDRIEGLRRATLKGLWTDEPALFPADDTTVWWEVWLRVQDGQEFERLSEFAAQAKLRVGDRLRFDSRIVVLVSGTPKQLSASLDVLNDLAELRLAKESPRFFIETVPEDQARWAKDLSSRITGPKPDAPAVCVLDTGVNREHPLLEKLLDARDAAAADKAWGTNDTGGGVGQRGHGTEMAGLAAYGDLAGTLAGLGPVPMRHRLESVKILPPKGKNDPQLYGAITAQAVSLPEIEAPGRNRVFSLAVTAPDQRDKGQPTSWSAALDALASGRFFDLSSKGLTYDESGKKLQRRLFVVSAGNVSEEKISADHISRCDLEPVHDPAQAWNALTVGACTEMSVLSQPDMAGWSPIAEPGEISPFSTTSVTFWNQWPVKPDVVFEGGNAAKEGANVDFGLANLSLLTTHSRPTEKMFSLIWATSAASAQVSRLGAIVRAEYPALWPESVRGLIVHSARWTPRMQARLDGATGRRDRRALLRRYGYGVPSEARALRSANDALTLLAQSSLRPFREGKMREMQIHKLPWPKTELLRLGSAPVTLRVTLSYFIEPNPARRGWRGRYRYASHGLRFDVKSPTESVEEFRKRLNLKALAEDEEKPERETGPDGWFLGAQARNTGSLHSDLWVGSAADLAERGVLAVFPVSGWWKDLPKKESRDFEARYSLIVSIETAPADVDIWTPVASQISVPVQEIGLPE